MQIIEWNDRFFLGEMTDEIEAGTLDQNYPGKDRGQLFLLKKCTGPYVTRAEAEESLRVELEFLAQPVE